MAIMTHDHRSIAALVLIACVLAGAVAVAIVGNDRVLPAIRRAAQADGGFRAESDIAQPFDSSSTVPSMVCVARAGLTMYRMVGYSPLGDGTPIGEPWYTSVTPVTNEAFLAFLRDTGYEPIAVRRGWGYRVSEHGRYVGQSPSRWSDELDAGSSEDPDVWGASPALGLEPDDWVAFMRWADCDEVMVSPPVVGAYAFPPKFSRRAALEDFAHRHGGGEAVPHGDEHARGAPR